MGQDVWYTYWFEKNLQGDIVAVYYQDGTKIASYTYDAWGNCTKTTHLSAGVYSYAQYNPFRYRGYYYDTTTGYYYLQSRYYNPGWGRFLNADSVLDGIGGELLGYNVFIYCMNDPVNFSDHEGDWPKWATKVLVAVAIVAVVATVAAITVATAGAGTAVAAIAVGAAKGAVIGAVTGAATGAATGAVKHRLSTGSWEGTGEAALDGMGNGALSGAITGAIAGGISGGVNYIRTNASATNRGFDTFQQLKKDIGSPGAGNEWHHIVEQNQIQKSGFSPRMIHNTNNIRAVPCQTHRAISGYYSSKQVFTNGMTVRNWLAGQSFSAQYDFGLSVLKMFL